MTKNVNRPYDRVCEFYESYLFNALNVINDNGQINYNIIYFED